MGPGLSRGLALADIEDSDPAGLIPSLSRRLIVSLVDSAQFPGYVLHLGQMFILECPIHSSLVDGWLKVFNLLVTTLVISLMSWKTTIIGW